MILNSIVVRDQYGKDVNVALIHFPLRMHKFAKPAALAAECAALQGNFEAFVTATFKKQDSLGVRAWSSYAKDADVADMRAFQACVDSAREDRLVMAGLAAGEKLGIHATPTILVNGWKFSQVPSPAQIDSVFRATKNGSNSNRK